MAKSESLTAAAKAYRPNRPRNAVYQVADQMPADLRAEFAALLADESVYPIGLAEALKARGYEINAHSIRTFRARKMSL